MPTKNSAVPPEIYQLKVILLGTSPPIWRRLLVPADLTLAQLHDVLQAAMGWQECHMHEFSVGGRHFGRPNPEDRLMGMPPVENERTVRLSRVLGRVGAKAIYTYDFGDSWEHGIVLEKRLCADPTLTYPVCTGGELACPPEDCGGIGGFYDLLDALGDPTHDQHDELHDWVGDDYDPDAFSIDDMNRMLSPLRRRRVKTSRSLSPAR
jgi:Plasmid pRiA4b ORF-3-like protein